MIQEKQLLAEEEPSVPISEMFEFVKWVDDSLYTRIVSNEWDNGNETITIEQLYQQFKQQWIATIGSR